MVYIVTKLISPYEIICKQDEAMIRHTLYKRRSAPILAPLILSVAAMFGPNANAAYMCSGNVTYLGVDVNGDVTVALSSTAIHKICNINGATDGFRATTPVCKTFYASILTARLQSKSISIYYDDNGYSCSTMPAWNRVPSVYFVQGPE
jgi:hypothetical protein